MAGGANPNMVQAASNPYSQAAAAQQGALATYANPAAAAANMMNPYQQQVVDTTIRDVGTAAQMGLNQIGSQAQGIGAFGGSRQAIAEAEALKGFNQQALDKVGALNQQGYNQAMSNAFNRAQGLQNVGQQSFNYGQSIQNQQMQQGALQQALMQNLANAGAKQYQGFTGQPQNALNTLLQTLTGQPDMKGQSTSFQPGLFNYLQTAAMIQPR